MGSLSDLIDLLKYMNVIKLTKVYKCKISKPREYFVGYTVQIGYQIKSIFV